MLSWLRSKAVLYLGAGLLVLGAAGFVVRDKLGRVPGPFDGVVVQAFSLPLVANATAQHQRVPDSDIVVLEFFDSTCGACRQILPKAQHRLQQPGVRFVAVSLDESRELAQRTAQEWNLVKPVAWDENWVAKRLFNVVGIPAMVIVGTTGEVAGWFAHDPSDSELEDAMERARATSGGNKFTP